MKGVPPSLLLRLGFRSEVYTHPFYPTAAHVVTHRACSMCCMVGQLHYCLLVRDIIVMLGLAKLDPFSVPWSFTNFPSVN